MLAIKSFQNPEANRDAVIAKSGYDFNLISHLSWEHIASSLGSNIDLKTCIPGLNGHQDPLYLKDVVVDSDLGLQSAFAGIDTNCPDEFVAAQELVRVFYFSSDSKLHVGEVLLHHALADDVRDLFSEVILPYQIPVGSMVPVSTPYINWNDYISMDNNNGSGFNYRQIINTDGVKPKLSLHALGLAVDINPLWNPCLSDGEVSLPGFCGKDSVAGYQSQLPPAAVYSFSNTGSFTDRHPVVLFLKARGWTWGGEWGDPKDLHHFQNIPAKITDEVIKIREQGIANTHSNFHADNNSNLAQALQKQGGVMLVGRSLFEYVKMFGLEELVRMGSLKDKVKVLDLASGVASFSAEMRGQGFNVHSADPIFGLPVNEIINRANPFLIDWASKFPNLETSFAGTDGQRPAWLVEKPLEKLDTPAKMLAIRQKGLELFKEDFTKHPDAYIKTQFPDLTGLNSEYDLILIGNFLMAYTSQNMDLTIRSILKATEFLSEAGQIRVYPAGQAFNRQNEILAEILATRGFDLKIIPSEHSFVKGWDAMYIIGRDLFDT